MYEGFESVQATIDGNVGTPAVNVSYVNGVLSFDFSNMKGNTGAAAGFGNVTAAVDGTIGTPGVTVQTDGPDTAKNIAFQFTGLKGETGVTSVIATVDNTSGNPQCAVSLNGQQLSLAFTGLKGAQGDTGVSADYPITIVNNLTTNDPASALSAAMGVQLESEISQLELKVDENLFPDEETEMGTGSVITGQFFNSSGTAIAFESYDIKLYSLTDISRVRIKATTAVDSLYLYAFYSSDTLTSANVVAMGEKPTNNSYDKTVDVPTGATYLAVTSWRTGGQITHIYDVVQGDALQEMRSDINDLGVSVLEIDSRMDGATYSKTFNNVTGYGTTSYDTVHLTKGLRYVFKFTISNTQNTSPVYVYLKNNGTTVVGVPAISDPFDPVSVSYEATADMDVDILFQTGNYVTILAEMSADGDIIDVKKLRNSQSEIGLSGSFSVNNEQTNFIVDVRGLASGKYIVGCESSAPATIRLYRTTGPRTGIIDSSKYSFITNGTQLEIEITDETNYLWFWDSTSATYDAKFYIVKKGYLFEKLIGNEKTIKVENGNTVTMCVPSAGKKLYIVIGPTEEGVGNGLVDFRYWGYVERNGDVNSTPTELCHSSSDCFGPFQIKAINNINGDDTSAMNFTGGSHRYNNAITGTTPTARLVGCSIRVDGRAYNNYEGNFNEFEMSWTNNIQATNTRKADGTGREVLVEYITLKYANGEFHCCTELVPLEDITLHLWYGYQIVGINPGGAQSISDHWKYVDAVNRTIDNNKSGNKVTSAMIGYTDDFHQEMWVDTAKDLGKRDFCISATDGGAFKSGSKGYFTIANNDATLTQNSHYFLYGKYIFKLK